MSLVVSGASWHYRLWREFMGSPEEEPRDLCSYFWGIMFFLLSVAMGIASVLVLAAVVGLSAYLLVTDPLQLLIYLALLLGMLISVFAAAALAIGLITLGKHLRPKSPERVHSTLSLVKAFLNARKRRICPLIEIEREES